MTAVKKIDSNVTGLRYAEEESLGILPGSPVWKPMEPNSYSDFGGEIETIARNPINPSRQRKKGVTTDLSASGGINTDITQSNIQDLLQGFLYADERVKQTTAVTDITGSAVYGMGDESGFVVGQLVFASGFADAANNGVKNVSAVAAGAVTVSEALVDDGAPSADAKLRVVGVTGATGDIDVDASGTLPVLTSVSLDFTTLGIIIGEWIYIGGDAALNAFSTPANNGFARVRAISANTLTLDKTEAVMVTEADVTQEISLFFGTVIKNELGSLIKRRTYQVERTLGASDDALLSEVQSEYLVGAVPSELTFNLPSADKVSLDMSFVATDNEQRTGATGVKSGTRPSLIESDAFNTSSDFARIKLAKIDGTSAPTDLFAFAEEITLTVNNNLDPNKALGVLGSFDVSAGTFEVGGSMTAYFADITSVNAVRNNDDVTLDIHMTKANAGISVDIPLISLGDGRLSVEQDQAIRLPLSTDAATGAKIDANMDYTLLFMFWDYLPSVAEV